MEDRGILARWPGGLSNRRIRDNPGFVLHLDCFTSPAPDFSARTSVVYDKSVFTGRTRGNRVCVFDADPRLVGQLVPLKIERSTVSTLYGSLVLSGVEN